MSLNLFGETATDFYARAHERLDGAISNQSRAVAGVYALLSGGNDSVAAALVASAHPKFRGAIHCNTGIGVEKTRQYVRDLCASKSWPLYELHPPAMTYEQMVLKHGFPGPSSHRYAYVWLKERALQGFVPARKERRTDIVALVTGVRTSESNRRMGTAKPVNLTRGQLWVAPLIDWPSGLPRQYRAYHEIAPNPVADKLCRSGECACGAYAAPGEREEQAMFYPELEEEIQRLEHLARKAGVHAMWGTEPPNKHRRYPEMPPLDEAMCTDCARRVT